MSFLLLLTKVLAISITTAGGMHLFLDKLNTKHIMSHSLTEPHDPAASDDSYSSRMKRKPTLSGIISVQVPGIEDLDLTLRLGSTKKELVPVTTDQKSHKGEEHTNVFQVYAEDHLGRSSDTIHDTTSTHTRQVHGF